MSRSQTPRTPVYFPRMKVRGKRNRAKLAARYSHRTVLPAMTVVGFDPATGAVTFATTPPAGRATHALVLNGPTRDGYGRVIPRPAAPPVKRPDKPSWSLDFTVKQTDPDLVRLLFGERQKGSG